MTTSHLVSVPGKGLPLTGVVGGLGGCEAPQEPSAGLLPVSYLSAGVEEKTASKGWTPAFPAADLVDAAASLFERSAPVILDTAERGRSIKRQPYVLEISPGVLGLTCSYHGGDRSDRRVNDVDWSEWLGPALDGSPAGFASAFSAVSKELSSRSRSGRSITSWSDRSRARLRRRLAELDYTPFIAAAAVAPPVMLTLTYPGDWLAVAPDGPTVKRHFSAFWKRWARRYGSRPPLLWKLEFQRRGAPHFHCLVPVPDRRRHYKSGPCDCFRCWVSGTWADVVACPDVSERQRHLSAGTGIDRDYRNRGEAMTDPRRLATYFLKHGSGDAKEYQHCVPDAWLLPGRGPGRFWGYHGLSRAVRTVPLSRADYHFVRRVLRRYMAAKSRVAIYPGGPTVPATMRRKRRRLRIDTATGEVIGERFRYSRERFTSPYSLTSSSESGGWIVLPDVPSLLSSLAPLMPSLEGR